MTSTATPEIDREIATELLHGLVAVPSISRQEEAASRWLVEQMQRLGFERAYVDEAGNAVGEMGHVDAEHLVVLLGHIDTVPGDIPVRIEATSGGDLLYGRGAVDAKGPLSTFVAATARLGDEWAREQKLRVVVVGAVEEEAATSKGARAVRDRFDGVNQPVPDACIIGEPSSWQRITLGYKGRILVNLEASQPMMHTAGPDRGIATVGVYLWNWLADHADSFNQDKSRTFDHLMPSLREIETSSSIQMEDSVSMRLGIRLPPEFHINEFIQALIGQVAHHIGAAVPGVAVAISEDDDDAADVVSMHGEQIAAQLQFLGYEPAWRSDRNNALVRSFLSAIRTISPQTRPAFVSKTGTSDMNVVGPAWQCPIVAYGPGDSSLDHTPNEHIALDEYWKAVLVLEDALRTLSILLDR